MGVEIERSPSETENGVEINRIPYNIYDLEFTDDFIDIIDDRPRPIKGTLKVEGETILVYNGEEWVRLYIHEMDDGTMLALEEGLEVQILNQNPLRDNILNSMDNKTEDLDDLI